MKPKVHINLKDNYFGPVKWIKFIVLLITLIRAEEVGAETSLLGVRNRTTPRIPVLMVWAYFHYITRNGM